MHSYHLSDLSLNLKLKNMIAFLITASVIMWALGAFCITNGLNDSRFFFKVLLSIPIIPWLGEMHRNGDRHWIEYTLLAVFFYAMSVFGIINLINIL